MINRRYCRSLLLATIAILCMACAHPATAQSPSDFSAGVSNNNGVVSLWFDSNVSSSWVDAHYSVNGGSQLNVTMNSSGSETFVYTITANVGDTVNYWFTYNEGGAAYNSATSSAVVSGGSSGQAATPDISPAGGTYSSAQNVTLSDSTSGASIYYTTDGSTPTTSSTLYTGAFTVSTSSTVNAVAVAAGMSNSATASASYTINSGSGDGSGSAPFTEGVTDDGSSVVIWFIPDPSSSLAIVHYDANGSGQENVNMTLTNGQWVQPIAATPGAAFTVSYSFTYMTADGAVDTAGYTWTRTTQVATPMICPYGGTFIGSQTVNMSDATSGASIYYTTDGSTPTTSSNLYTAPLSVTSSCTVNALAVESGMSASSIASAAFTITSAPTQVTEPVFSLAGGSYTGAQSVALSDATSGAAIYYTTDGSTPSTSSTLYTGPITVSASGTINAIGVLSGLSNSAMASASYTINTGSGPYAQGVTDNGSTVTIWFTPTSTCSWVIVHYVLNGGGQQNVYMTQGSGGQWLANIAATPGAAVSLSYSFTYDTASGADDSSSYTWSRTVQAATPVVSPAGGTYSTAQSVTLTDTTAGASIYYTTDGSTPTTASALYTSAFPVSSNCTINAIAAEAGIGNSSVASAAFTITAAQVATPTISPNGGSYTSALSVTLADATSGASIYYTTNGSVPTTASSLYTGAFAISATTTVNAVATESGMSSSNVASAAFTIGAATVATPTFMPAGGTYTSAQTVTIACATSGARVYYTTDGSTPTTASALYTGPITVASSSTVNALAVESGMTNSPVGSAVYTISASNSFSYGVTESGATAYVWFGPTWTPTTAIAHYYVTANGVNGAENDVAMTFNASLNQWVAPTISPVAAGQIVNYSFTYSPASGGGNVDSPWYTYTICGDSATCAGQVGRPIISLASGVYPTAQSVTLSLPSSVPSGSEIYYTLDGSTPTKNSTLYNGAAITVSTALTLSAITVEPDNMQSSAATATYDIATTCTSGCTVAAPTFSIPAGTYNTVIGVNMLTATTGATIHYTIDGSTPTASSAQYSGAIWLYTANPGPTTTIKAVASLNGVTSSVSSATYTITSNNQSTWNGLTTFNIANGTNGEYTNSQIYWQIIGIDWNTGQYVHVDMNGNLIPMTLADDTIPVPGLTTDYANYAVSLAQSSTVTIPPIESARIYISLGSPVLIQVNTNDLGQIGYAGPNLDNPTDPNLGVLFDFGEFNINQPAPLSITPGIFANTSRVDLFGFPLQLNVTGLDGYNATVGEPLTETRAQLFARFTLEVPTQFQGLAQAPYAPYRIVAPAHASFDNGIDVTTGAQTGTPGANSTYLDSYITAVWNQLKTTPVTLNLENGWPTFTGSVDSNNVLTFTDGEGSYSIYGQPTTTEVMLGDGLLNDPTGTTPNTTPYLKQLQLQAQVCAALNRHVADQAGSNWWNGADFYAPGSLANWYTWYWHQHSINGLAYGFSYDDVGGFSPSIYTPSPQSVTFTVGQ